MKKCGIIILAAGASSRLGTPKQLLPYGPHNLIRHTMQIAIHSIGQPIVVVIGANASLIKYELDNASIHIAQNLKWSEGISSSIKTGIAEILALEPQIESFLFMVCDQPYVSTDLVNNLIQKSASENKIAASTYDNTVGIPAVFPKRYFAELQKLSGDEGAKKIINQNTNELVTIPFIKGGIDIDTIHDYENLLEDNNF